MTTISTGARGTIARIRDTVSDMNYAQRRLVEINWGIPPEEDKYRRRERDEIEALEALFELDS